MKMKNMAAIFLFLLICSSSLLTTSCAGRGSKFNKVVGSGNAVEEVREEAVVAGEDDAAATIHERLLRTNAKDYGRYDPAPALVRPPFKLIPN